jgi:hypothetical protein
MYGCNLILAALTEERLARRERPCMSPMSPVRNDHYPIGMDQLLIGSGGPLPTNSRLVIPFTSVDRRRKIVSIEIPSHCGKGHSLTPDIRLRRLRPIVPKPHVAPEHRSP